MVHGDDPTRKRFQFAQLLAFALRHDALCHRVADLTVASLGGSLKTKQKLSGRLADALSELLSLIHI